MNVKHCSGCRNNIYNHGHLGINECWSLKSAKLVRRKKVPSNMRPPWNMRPIRVPNCYHQVGYAFVDPEAA